MRKIKVVIVILAILAVAGAGIYFLCPLKTIEIEGNEYYTKEVLEQALFPSALDKNLVYSMCRYHVKKRELPYIKDYTFEVTGLNSIKVTIYEKKIVAGLEYMGEYVYFDRDGMVLESTTKKKKGIPYFKNIAFKNFSLYTTLQLDDSQIWTKILNLSRLLSGYDVEISKISFTDKDEVTLVSGNVKIYLGNKEAYDDEFSALESVLQKTKENKLSGTIDMRNYVSGAQIILERSEQ